MGEGTNERLPLRRSGPIAGGVHPSLCRPRSRKLLPLGGSREHSCTQSGGGGAGHTCSPESREIDKWTNGGTEGQKGQDVGFVSLSMDGWMSGREGK